MEKKKNYEWTEENVRGFMDKHVDSWMEDNQKYLIWFPFLLGVEL
jgi:hypothetical protein